MLKNHRYVLMIGLVFLVACSAGSEEPAPPAPGDTAQRKVSESWRDERLALGRETYELACASCHDTVKGDAPLTGNPKHWSDRSLLWEAVLFEHAKSGYLEMPEKGGHPELTEDSVEAAAEYMLGVTFPELPRD